jgi:hypothetical protein
MSLLLTILFAVLLQSHNPMGFDQNKTTHHFILTSSGGYIEVAVRDSSDQNNLAAIRKHLAHIAAQFKAGDFNIPMLVHGEQPSGAETMKRLKDRIEYQFTQVKNGARVTITTDDRDVLQAIHDFLRYQIREHKTGDKVTVSTGATPGDK